MTTKFIRGKVCADHPELKGKRYARHGCPACVLESSRKRRAAPGARAKRNGRLRGSRANPKGRARYRKLYSKRAVWKTAYQSLRRRAKGAPHATVEELKVLWEKQQGLCAFSGMEIDRKTAHLDHIVPPKQGGAHTIENLQFAHGAWNRAKSNMPDHEFRIFLARLVLQHVDELELV